MGCLLFLDSNEADCLTIAAGRMEYTAYITQWKHEDLQEASSP
jgi:hypothetical protein